MISIIQEKFDSPIADNIIRFMEHPTAPLIRRFKEYTDLLHFDEIHDWHKWVEVLGFQTIPGSRRAYVTYIERSQAGVVRLPDRDTGSRKVWYVWSRGWGRPITLVDVPRELVLVGRYDDGYQAIKLVMDDYVLKEGENLLDDVEDENDEDYPDSEVGLRHDEDDDNSERSDAETEYADEALVYAQVLNNEAREEIASLMEQIRIFHEQMRDETNGDGLLTLGMLIRQADVRCEELRREIANRGDLTS